MKKLYAPLFLLILVITALAQTPTPAKDPYPLKEEEQLEVRNLQYEIAKRMIRIHQLEAETAELNKRMTAWIEKTGQAKKVDGTKYYFNTDAMKFVEIPK